MIRNALYRTLWTGAALAVSVFSLAPMSAQIAPAARRITTTVNNADRVSLSGSLRKNLKAATDLGSANASMPARHVMMTLQRSDDRQAALDQYLSDVQNPDSAQYHQWLTPIEYGARFGASADDVQAITAWLQSQGLTIEKTSPAANVITFSGTVGQLQAAFSTSIHSVMLNGEKHVSALSEPQVPRAIAPAVKSIMGLSDFHPHSNLQHGGTATFNSKTRRIEPNFTLFDSASNSYLYVDPADAATIYNTPNSVMNPNYSGTNYDGTGVTVGIVGDSNITTAPVVNYRTAFLNETTSTANLPTVILDGEDPGINNDEEEAFLDVEVLGGLAPKAKINFYTGSDSDLSAGLFNAIQRAINDNTISILSISFSECEALAGTATTQGIAELFQQAAAQGITVLVSSGDSGSANCDADSATSVVNGLAVNALGSSPYNVSVGGTDYPALAANFSQYADSKQTGNPPYWRTAISYIPEVPWNDSTSTIGSFANNTPLLSAGKTNVIGGGGGKSSVFTKPAFQSALTPVDGARDMPDVSFLAANGLYSAVWAVCLDTTDCANASGEFTSGATFEGAGGTSASTPAFAGMLALAVQATGARLGQADNVLYNLAATKYSTVFHDITSGNNAVVCTAGSTNCGSNGFTTGYDAVTGYDLASGLGSVNAAAMISNWAAAKGTSSTTTMTINNSTSPVSVTHGTSLNFAIGINPTTATGSVAIVNTAPAAAAGGPTLNGAPYTVAISNGAGSTTYNGLPGGQYTVYANYSGDASTAASQSTPISVNIAAENSSTKLWLNVYAPSGSPLASQTTIPYGSYVFAEGSVYGTAEGYDASTGLSVGTLTYSDNGASIGTAPITSANFASFPVASATTYAYAVGSHKLTATFPGDTSYKANTSNEVDFTVVKGSTTPILYPTSKTVTSSTNDNIEVDITTASLGVAPTGTITLTANGKTLGSTSTFLTGYESADDSVVSYVVFPVAGSQLANGSNTITATYSGDSNYSGSTGTTTVTESQSSFTLKTSAISINAGAATGNTATLSVVPAGSFAGLVDLSCTVTTVPANATSPVTCTVPASILVTGTGTVTGTLTVNSTASTTAGSYVVTITGKDDATKSITATTTSTITVTGTPGVTLANSAPITLTAGASSGNTSTLTVTPTSGFTGAVSLSCAVTMAPGNAVNPITCGLSPASVTISGTTASTSVLTIASTARTTSALDPTRSILRGVGGTVLAFGLFFFVPTRRRRQLRGLAALIVLVSLGSMVGCGGGGSGSNGGNSSPTQSGTTAGAYTVTVTATPTGGTAQTTTVSVTVN
ncbi:MAG: protease pro-enzyme activation domain-containing protein [Acidobacteriaceae bacterium]|nr:protease pro-enzyme activation domain-containing protein [Acidobacteriaceae bacterium]